MFNYQGGKKKISKKIVDVIDLITLFILITQDCHFNIPKVHYTKENFNQLSNCNTENLPLYDIARRAFYMTVLRQYRNQTNLTRDFVQEGLNSITKFRNVYNNFNIQNIATSHVDYSDILVPNEISLIYCDPPYFNNKYDKNKLFYKFNHKNFWEFVDKLSINHV
eukprot:Pgem_evm1s18123